MGKFFPFFVSGMEKKLLLIFVSFMWEFYVFNIQSVVQLKRNSDGKQGKSNILEKKI